MAKGNRTEVSPLFSGPEIEEAFAAFPEQVRPRLLALRRLIFDVAAETEGVGPLEECLKWGEPAYLTTASHSGTTIRIAWKAKTPDSYGLYVNCRTALVDSYRAHFGKELRFQGNRAVLLDANAPLPEGPLRACIAMALTYRKKRKAGPKAPL